METGELLREVRGTEVEHLLNEVLELRGAHSGDLHAGPCPNSDASAPRHLVQVREANECCTALALELVSVDASILVEDLGSILERERRDGDPLSLAKGYETARQALEDLRPTQLDARVKDFLLRRSEAHVKVLEDRLRSPGARTAMLAVFRHDLGYTDARLDSTLTWVGIPQKCWSLSAVTAALLESCTLAARSDGASVVEVPLWASTALLTSLVMTGSWAEVVMPRDASHLEAAMVLWDPEGRSELRTLAGALDVSEAL
jgi:hypothetical protein